jgi:alcohol dehydrogenase class IV
MAQRASRLRLRFPGDPAAAHGAVQRSRYRGRTRTRVAQRPNGIPASCDSAGTLSSRRVERVLDAIEVPTRLRDVDVNAGSLAAIAGHALDDWLLQRLPRSAQRDELEGILRAAW